MKYIIHLNVEDYETKKKESKKDVEMGKQSLVRDAQKAFALALRQDSQVQGHISILNEEYKGQTMTTAVYVDLNDAGVDDLVNVLRKMDIVAMIEKDFAASVEDSKPKADKKSVNRFLK